MPMVNMKAALTNPYTLDTFTVIRSLQIITDFGEVRLQNRTIPNIKGVVYPESPNDLERQPDKQLQGKTIAVITRFALRGSSELGTNQDFQPDIVVWNSNNFIVVHVSDYSNFAQGFIRAQCRIIDSMAAPPSTVTT